MAMTNSPTDQLAQEHKTPRSIMPEVVALPLVALLVCLFFLAGYIAGMVGMVENPEIVLSRARPSVVEIETNHGVVWKKVMPDD